MRRQCILYVLKGLLTFALTALSVSPGVALVLAAPASEPEDSPLYARSRQGAFADMAARDHGTARARDGSPRPATGSGAVIVVDGMQWYNGSATGLAGSSRVSPVRPLSATTDYTCAGSTCGPPTCDTTCTAGRPSCGQGVTCTLTCANPGPTCYYPTCTPNNTCYPVATCFGPTCSYGFTCVQAPTCKVVTCNGAVTCTGPTCQGTCTPSSCPTALSAVSVPQAGQIQLSFSSSAQLNYVLQYCTNLAASGWMQACSTNGNGGMVTLCHTNGAAVALYRLLIQTP